MRRLSVIPLLLIMTIVLATPALSEDDVFFSTPAPASTPEAIEIVPGEVITPVPTATPKVQADGSVILTMTAVGDVTIGRNVQHSGTSIFEKELKKQNNDPNFIFKNVKEIFENDDVTIINFEGVLADEYKIPSEKRENSYLFLAPTEYGAILPNNSVEMATIENNHIGDFGQNGIDSTSQVLTENGIAWANMKNMASYEAQGMKIALLAYQTLNQPFTSSELKHIVADDIEEAKKTHDLVVVYFHWGNELDYAPRDNQVMLGRSAIDSGADLVLGAHSHRINPIECYNGRYIVYSLANCSFAGNNKPSDMYTFIFQTRFKIKDGEILQNAFRIIPCRISSRKDYNDFTITPLKEITNIDTVINTMISSGKKLEYAVKSYPLEWE